MPAGYSGADARKAALMTYILNCGTDYGKNPRTDFGETPYSAAEVQRIADRQEANAWSYDKDVDFVHDNGGRLMTTPNGMLMGMGGNQLQDFFSEGGGSTWGDIFMVNIDDPANPAQTLRDMVDSGVMWYPQKAEKAEREETNWTSTAYFITRSATRSSGSATATSVSSTPTPRARSSTSSPTIRWKKTPAYPMEAISDRSSARRALRGRDYRLAGVGL